MTSSNDKGMMTSSTGLGREGKCEEREKRGGERKEEERDRLCVWKNQRHESAQMWLKASLQHTF